MPQVQVSHSGRSLTEGVDYKVRYIGNTEGGTAYAMVMGMGQYTDYTLVPFTIAPSRDLSGFSVKQPANRVYTGKENKPSSITVKDASGKTLKNGLDYTWTVSNAVEVGAHVRRIEQAALPIGIIPTLKLTHRSAPLALGDIIVMVSDGITEADKEDDEARWLQEILRQIRTGRESAETIVPRRLARKILEEAQQRCGCREHDDLTVLVALVESTR